MVAETPAYNDRPIIDDIPISYSVAADSKSYATKIPKPELSIVVSGNTVNKPGMKAAFIDDDKTVIVTGAAKTSDGGYCTCNAVSICTCNTVCTCEAVPIKSTCSCVSVQKVCTCNTVCTCTGQCSCVSNYYTTCTCNKVCTCIPVYR